MHSEDDTYDALRRLPYRELVPLVISLEGMFNHSITDNFSQNEIDWLKSKGWTLLDFIKAWRDHKFGENSEIQEFPWWKDINDRITELENGRR